MQILAKLFHYEHEILKNTSVQALDDALKLNGSLQFVFPLVLVKSWSK
jgi:hypothetical protein